MDTKYIYSLLSDHIKGHTKIFIAVSGGVDSMVIFDIVYLYFLKFGYNTKHIYIGHYNHSFREESKSEEAGIMEFFSDKNVNLIVKKYEGNQFDEKTLRDARWGFFGEVINKYNINYILTGHHADDRIETSIINQIRGSGLKGTINMQSYIPSTIYQKSQKYHQNFLGIMRPLIQTKKQDIYIYARDLGIKYREDHTNQNESISFRNYIRKQIKNTQSILGENLYNMTPISVEKDLYNLDINNLTEAYSQDISNIYINQLTCESRYITLQSIYRIENIGKLRSTNQIVYILDQFGLANNISRLYIEDLWKFLLFGQSGYKELDKETRLYICHNRVYITKYILDNSKKQFENSYLDYYNNLASHFPEYKVRLLKSGDKFHGKSINEYLSNRKIPVFYREYVVLQEDKNGKIVNIFLNYEMINGQKSNLQNIKLAGKL